MQIILSAQESYVLYQFPIAAVRKNCNFGGLKQQPKFVIFQFHRSWKVASFV